MAAPGSNTFAEIIEAQTPLTPSLTGVINVGTVVSGSTTGIGINIPAGSRLLYVVSVEGDGLLDVAALTGTVSGSILLNEQP